MSKICNDTETSTEIKVSKPFNERYYQALRAQGKHEQARRYLQEHGITPDMPHSEHGKQVLAAIA